MTTDHTLAFVVFAIVAAITPGPSNVILAATGANAGVRRGIPCLFGVTGGMGLMLFVVALGFGRLVLDQPRLQFGLKWGGIAFLLWLAWRIATARRFDSTTDGSVVGFWKAAAFQWVNPKSWLISASAVGPLLAASESNTMVQATSLAVLFFLAAFPSCAVWLVAGAAFRRLLASERAGKAFNRSMGALLAASVILFI